VSVARLLDGKRIVVCAGPGGVGKTTTAAAIALGMAEQGLKVAVLTIDPARRLANSLGLAELGNQETRVPIDFDGDGELWALMLDAKRTWDEVIERHAADDATRDAVLNNRIYKELSNAVAGSTEYMAMEKLYELYQEDRYDLLVLDTPPTRNALDFLDAPQRLSRFIDSRSLQFFLKPGRFGLKVLGRGGSVLFSVLKRVTGVDLLRDLSDFFNSFGDMAAGIQERAERVAELLGDRQTTFLVITSPQRDSIDEAIFFRRRLREGGMPFGGAVVNRVHDQELTEGDDADDVAEQVAALLGDDKLARKVARNYDDYRELAEHDRESIDRLRHETGGGAALILVPYLEDDVHDADGLHAMNAHLFAADTVSAR
jgi:anion-transporting  ArsA/GET3 family ATPase